MSDVMADMRRSPNLAGGGIASVPGPGASAANGTAPLAHAPSPAEHFNEGTTMSRIEDHGDTLAIALDPAGVFARAEFPHPLITLDYDADDKLVQVVAAGRMVGPVLSSYALWREHSDDTERLADACRKRGIIEADPSQDGTAATNIESGTFYYAVCGTCGERIQRDDDGGYMVAELIEEVREFIIDHDGRITDDGAVTCNACVEEERVLRPVAP